MRTPARTSLALVAASIAMGACEIIGGLQTVDVKATSADAGGLSDASSEATVSLCGSAPLEAGPPPDLTGCDAGAGTTPTFLEPANFPSCVQVDEANFYWGADAIYSAPKALDSGAPTRFIGASGVVSSCVLTPASIIYACYEHKDIIAWTGGGAAPRTVVVAYADSNTIQNIAIGYTPLEVYWTNTTDGIVAGCTAADNCSETPFAQKQNIPYGIVVDDTNVYWTNFGAGTVITQPRADGGVPSTIAANQSNPSAIALDSAAVYWTTQGGDVMAWNKATCAVSTLATGQGQPAGIVADPKGDSVYWVNAAGGQVMSAPKAGGCPVTIAQGQAAPSAVAVDDTYVYWTNDVSIDAGGAVVRAPK